MLRLTQGSPPDLALNAVIDVIKPSGVGEPEAVRGQRVVPPTAGESTDDSGPEKPGNPDKSGEGKTLTIRKIRVEKEIFDREPAIYDGQHTSEGKIWICLISCLDDPRSRLDRGKSWTRGDGDTIGEPN